jgi:hypothetical protein
MSKIWKIAGLVGLFVLVLGAAGWGGFGGGMYGGEESPYHEIMMGSFAEALGISLEQIEERLVDGETMWQIAESAGFTGEEFAALMQAARTAMLEQAIEDGYMTEERAGFMNSGSMRHGFSQGYEGCMGYENFVPQGSQQRPGGRWNAP